MVFTRGKNGRRTRTHCHQIEKAEQPPTTRVQAPSRRGQDLTVEVHISPLLCRTDVIPQLSSGRALGRDDHLPSRNGHRRERFERRQSGCRLP